MVREPGTLASPCLAADTDAEMTRQEQGLMTGMHHVPDFTS